MIIGSAVVGNTHLTFVSSLTFSDFLVDTVSKTVDYALGSQSDQTSSESKFAELVQNVLERAEVSMSTLLVTLVYINRAKPHLH